MQKTLNPVIRKKIRDAVERSRLEGRPLAVLFVCLGNICRSPAADGIMRKLAEEAGMKEKFLIDSCGFYGGHAGDLPDRRMRTAALHRGYHLDHRSRTIRTIDFDNFDLIFGMDQANIDDLRRVTPTLEAEEKIIPMAALALNHPEADVVPDPYWSGADGFYLVLDLLEDACTILLDEAKDSGL
ncbi:MAG: low molecular weight phosphotyrosine protein phosphatase [Muribaculaceae bacterium]|nr:low molecular weight phosphotyrosine protein phosphatase [Muribaculaceae bacterium]